MLGLGSNLNMWKIRVGKIQRREKVAHEYEWQSSKLFFPPTVSRTTRGYQSPSLGRSEQGKQPRHVWLLLELAWEDTH